MIFESSLKRWWFVWIGGILIGLFFAWLVVEEPSARREVRSLKTAEGIKEDPRARAEQEFLMLRDPTTKKIPDAIRERELEFARSLPRKPASILQKGSVVRNVQSLAWQERGPSNVGGRTRAFGVDSSDPNTLIAGGVSGGLWKSTNDGATWSKTTTSAQLHSVSCLVQDRRTGKTHVWYAGTGEADGNSASQYGAPFRGDGVYKSTDNGSSWTLLTSTSTNIPNLFDKLFDYVWNIAVDISNQEQDEVYAATYGAIYRSTNGGQSWSVVLGGTSPYSVYTDVQVTSTGVLYAALSEESSSKGIWRSTDGVSWTNITPAGFPSSYYRIVIGIAPSNESMIYFLGNTPGSGKAGDAGYGSEDYHSFWLYDDGTATWTNRSSNLPTWTNPVAGYSSQISYDMIVAVKPDDPNFVIIGGTNLYRSTNGFATSNATTWIGGYSTANNVSIYSNHHPDQHSFGFRAGSPGIFYSGHDGGISKTTNVAASSVTWSSLNNGYNVTQFYSISLAPESGSNLMMGGTQDNGTQLGIAPGIASWSMAESGDGTIVKVAPLADDRLYTAYQIGGLRRRTRAGVYLADFTPQNSTNQLFVNPVVLDPNNSMYLYYPAGKSTGGPNAEKSAIWRHSNAPFATSTGWTTLSSTDVGAGSGYARRISAIGVSKANDPNVLYYGTSDGIVKKLVNAHSAGSSAPVETITPTSANTTPPTDLQGGTSAGGYVACIAVDPTNSAKAILAFSNYNFPSLWYTTNGGTTWTDVEGNLAGSSGPSIRWVSIFYKSGVLHVFLATSVGVFYTTELNSSSTLWTQEAVTAVGNVVTVMVDYRSSDDVIALATHGRGVFTTQIEVALPVELVTFGGEYKNGVVMLTWETATEANSYGFDLERNFGDGWEKIGFLAGYGTSSSPRTYQYQDTDPILRMQSRVLYRLRQINTDGSYLYSGSVEVEIDHGSSGLLLFQNYPNPFNPTTTFRYVVPIESNVRLVIFDVQGRMVDQLVSELQRPGEYQIDYTTKLPSGLYLYALEVDKFRLVKKMVIVR